LEYEIKKINFKNLQRLKNNNKKKKEKNWYVNIIEDEIVKKKSISKTIQNIINSNQNNENQIWN
jgi:hypothetical protein